METQPPLTPAPADPVALKERERLAAPPFPTFAAPLHPEATDELRGWTPPRGAYVMLESPKIHLLPGAVKRPGAGLTFVDVSSAPDQQTLIEYYIRKGGRVLHWGNFPKNNSDNAKDKELAQMHRNAWDNLEVFLRGKLADAENAARAKRLEDENDALKRKLAEAEAKLAARAKDAARPSAREA